MTRKGTLFDAILQKNPKLADVIRRTADLATGGSGKASVGSKPSESSPLSHPYPTQTVQVPHGPRHSAIGGTRNQNQSGRINALKAINAYIGFDFGTSCTKVVIRHRKVADHDEVLPVDFGNNGHKLSSYLVPTALYYSPDRTFLLSTNGSQNVTNLKTALMDNLRHSVPGHTDVLPCTVAAAAYVALVLRSSKQWYREAHSRSAGNVEPRWFCNFGIPAANFSDEGICRRFAISALAGWELARSQLPLTREAVTAACKHAEGVNWNEAISDSAPHGISLVPEVAAAVSAYARSRIREPGPHILMDVGAGTLDLSCFRINDPNGDFRFSLLVTKVDRLGVMYLLKVRTESLARSVMDVAHRSNPHQDPVVPIPMNSWDHCPQEADLDSFKAALSNAEGDFQRQCGGLIRDLMTELRKRRDPRWRGTVPLIFSGGGARLPLFHFLADQIRLLSGEALVTTRVEPRPLTWLDVRGPGLREEDAYRFAVGWGLSLPRLEIGDIVPPEVIPDIPIGPSRQGSEPSERFIGKEQT